MPLPQTNITAFDGIDIPTRADPANWNERSEDGWARLKPGGDQFNVLATQVNTMADTANAAATAAGDAADSATTKADEASASASNAATSASAAATSAAAAANSAAATKATSTTTLSVSSGAKVVTIQAGKQFALGDDVKFVDAGNAANAMYGTVTSYSGTTLNVNITTYTGSGPVSNWLIGLTGQRGAPGAAGSINGGNLTGSLNDLRSPDLASSAEPNVWGAGGDYIVFTGSAAVTGFPDAPQAGASRMLLVTGSPAFTESANLLIKGGSFTAAPGDEIFVRAETTTKFRVTRIPASGMAPAQQMEFLNATLMEATGVYVPAATGVHEIVMAGPAGRGGTVYASATGGGGVATGAGGGGFLRKRLVLTGGTPYLFNAGAGVPSLVGSPAGGLQQGADGGDSTFSGPDIATLTAGGGKAGAAAVTGPLSGGLGGIATGGDINYPGGRGGNITGNVAGGRAATGGGALNITGTARNGGDATVTASPVATGGASPGGSGGNATAGGASGGGGVGGSAANISTAIAGTAGPGMRSNIGNLLNIFAAGTPGVLAGATPATSDGGASGGKLDVGGGVPSAKGGLMAGSGGFVQTDSTGTVNAAAGAGGDLGGASGGSVRYATSGSSTATGGATDDGWCLIRRM